MKTCLAGLAGLACASLLLAASPVVAHHSAAMFDPGHQVHIQGIVKEVQWTNPHAWIHVLSKTEGGKEQLWSFETEGPNLLTRAGITRGNLKIGEMVTVTGSALRDGRPGASMVSIETADGAVLSLNPDLRKAAP